MTDPNLRLFKIEEIDQIDYGELAIAINKAIHQCYLDCESRPALTTARDVNLKISLKPMIDGRDLARVDVTFDLKKSMPSQSVVVAMRPADGGLAFQPEAPDNPNQRTMGFHQDDSPPPPTPPNRS